MIVDPADIELTDRRIVVDGDFKCYAIRAEWASPAGPFALLTGNGPGGLRQWPLHPDDLEQFREDIAEALELAYLKAITA